MTDTRSQFLYRLELVRASLLTEGPTEEEAAVLQAHGGYLADLASSSDVLLAGRTQTGDSPFGLVIINETTHARATEIMENDPAVKHGVMKAELFPYQIAVLSKQITNVISED